METVRPFDYSCETETVFGFNPEQVSLNRITALVYHMSPEKRKTRKLKRKNRRAEEQVEMESVKGGLQDVRSLLWKGFVEMIGF